jgi:hypothetical protein
MKSTNFNTPYVRCEPNKSVDERNVTATLIKPPGAVLVCVNLQYASISLPTCTLHLQNEGQRTQRKTNQSNFIFTSSAASIMTLAAGGPRVTFPWPDSSHFSGVTKRRYNISTSNSANERKGPPCNTFRDRIAKLHSSTASCALGSVFVVGGRVNVGGGA